MIMGFVAARTWTPVGDIDLKNFYSIRQANNVNASSFCTGSTCGTVPQFLSGGGNSSWNESYADDLYLEKKNNKTQGIGNSQSYWDEGTLVLEGHP